MVMKLWLLLALIHGVQCSLDIFVISSCYTGHVQTILATSRVLAARGHKVDVALLDTGCCMRYKSLVRGVNECIDYSAVPEIADVKNANQVETMLGARQQFINLTKGPYEITFARLKASKYDVVFYDFALLGTPLAGKAYNVPMICNYIFADTSLTKKQFAAGIYPASLFTPYSSLPEFVLRFLNELIWEILYMSTARFNFHYRQSLLYENNLQLRSNYENDGMIVFNVHRRYAVSVYHGSPQMVLMDPSYANKIPNYRYAGFIPDSIQKRELTSNLKEFIEKSDKPVVYLSLGTYNNLNLEEMKSVLADLQKQREFSIIWAIKRQLLDDMKPFHNDKSHLYLGEMLPQIQILLHKTVKVFITHCGINSITEGIYGEKPMLLFPIMGDQPINALRSFKLGVGMPLESLNYAHIKGALNKIMTENNYQQIKSRMQILKKEMVSLGGYETAADVVEKVASKEIKFTEMPQSEITNIINYLHMKIRLILIGVCFTAQVIINVCMPQKHEKVL